MELIEAIIYGIIQGLCEFLPISSSAHLSLAHYIMGSEEEALAFDVLLHTGTLISVFTVYRKDIAALARAFFSLFRRKDPSPTLSDSLKESSLCADRRLILYLLLSSLLLIPAALIENAVSDLSKSPAAIGTLLIVNSVLLLLPSAVRRKTRPLSLMRAPDAVFIGLTQLFAVFPGISRSGSTTVCGILRGLDREAAVKYSFLLSIPAVAGASLLKLPALFSALPSKELLFIYIAGALSSALFGILAISLVRLITKHSAFPVFSLYSLVAGVSAILLERLG